MTDVLTTREGDVLRIVLNRPEKLNAVNTPMLAELKRVLDEAAADETSVVVLTGAGRAFCSGGDLSGKQTNGAGELANAVVQAIIESPKPVVAGVHGHVAGVGCPLALACDLVVAARSASFQLAFSRVGLMPDAGTAAILPAAIGRPRATRMALLGEKVLAPQAFEWGMISHLVDDGDFEAELASVSRELVVTSGPAIARIKQAIRVGTMTTLAAVQADELQGQYALTETSEFRQSVAAFRGSTRGNRSS
ncbi:crotonase [Mycolicibacterium sp. (ex Dasyatis americana)]|nr:crotonase [Mycolicibacterium sp. (ex Dasyatis americana)]